MKYFLPVFTFFFLLAFIPSKTIAENPGASIELNQITNNFSTIKTNIPEPKEKPSIQADHGKYIIFNNLDNPVILTEAYIKYFSQSQYASDFDVASFSDAFFEQYDLTEYDVAVFPMGNFALQISTENGIRVIDKISEMLDAGKGVIITGRVIFLAQYRNGQADDDVKAFLENTMGTEYLGWRPTCDTSGKTVTFRQFNAKGAAGDPVSIGFNKDCNVISDGVPPLAYYFNVDCFKSKDQNTYFPVDYLLQNREAVPNDTLLGIRVSTQSGGKAVLWSFGFEVMCHDHDRNMNLIGAMKWLLQPEPGQGPEIEFVENQLNFGSVEVGETGEATAVLRNSGSEALQITDLYVEEFLTENIFKINDDDGPYVPKTLMPGEYLKVKMSFSPDEDRDFIDYLLFKSNDVNANGEGLTSLELKGTGGKGVAPFIEANYDEVIDFGEVEPNQKVVKDLVLTNTGNRELIINIIALEDNEKSAFFFVYGSGVPAVLEPGESREVRIQFVAQQEDSVYTAKLKVLNTSKNKPEWIFSLKGKGKNMTSVGEWAKTSDGKSSVRIFPNPVNGYAKIHYKIAGLSSNSVNIKISDMNGRTVELMTKELQPAGDYFIEKDFSGLIPGHYVLLFNVNGSSTTLPVEILR